EQGADERFVLGYLGDHHVRLPEQVHRAYRQQVGVTGTAAHERHPGGGEPFGCLAGLASRHAFCTFAGRAVSSAFPPSSSAAPSASISSASRVPTSYASSGSPVADIRTDSDPSGESATARTQISSPSSPSTTSASAPTGAEQPAPSPASTARSAVTATRERGSST